VVPGNLVFENAAGWQIAFQKSKAILVFVQLKKRIAQDT
jgi:hypothetical protein